MFQATTATHKLSKLKKRIRGIAGGTSASKTISILLLLINQCQRDKEKKLTSVVSESVPHLKKGVIRDFKNIMQQHRYWKDINWNATDFVYTFETGSQIEFFSADNGDKLRGARRDRLFINEANNVEFEAFNQLEVRTKEVIWLDWNPTTEFWFYTEVKDNDSFDTDFLILTYKDNEALDLQIVKSIEARQNNKNWWRVYGLGLLGEIEGLIYKDWKQIDSIPHEARLEKRWLDFGYTNDPSAIGEVYYHNGGWILNELLYRKGMSNKQLADFLNALESPETTIIADSAEPKSIDEISSYGLNIVGCKKGKDSVNTGIQLVQDQPITVTKHSINIIKEQRGYMWATDKNGKVLNEEDPACANHHMSGVRYALGTLGRIKQEETYWDRMFKDELHPEKIQFNKGK